MITRWSFYSLETGVFTGGMFHSQTSAGLAANTPPGCGAMPGTFNHERQRVDIATGEVVAYQPGPPPDDEWRSWLWSEEAGKWLAAPTLAALARDARAERDRLIAACDWVMLRAAERGESAPAAWLAYRAALRDVPTQASFPLQIVWPEAPQAA